MCSPNGRKTNKKASSIKKRLYRSVLKLLLIFLAHGEWELAPVPQDGCCGVIGPNPRPLSIRGTQIFCRLILPTISPNRQGRSMIWLSLSLGLRRLGRFRKFSLLMLFAALLPRLLALAFGLRGLGNRICFLGVFCRHIAPPIHHHPSHFRGYIQRNGRSGNR